MGTEMAAIIFLILAIVWILLPFVPSLREVRRRDDVEPLPVHRNSQVDIRHFANSFSEYVVRCFGDLRRRCVAENGPLTGVLDDGTAYLLLPGGDAGPLLDPPDADPCERMILCPGDLQLPADRVHTAEVHAEGNLSCGERSVYRAILADGDMTLGAGSASLRWVHSGGELVIGPRCLLSGRVSSAVLIEMAAGCRFERLHAPRLVFGGEIEADQVTVADSDAKERHLLEAADVPNLDDQRAGRWLIRKQLDVAPDSLIRSDLVVLGEAVLGRGTRLEGSIKSRKAVVLEPDVRVTGSLVSDGDLFLGAGCRVDGPVICEGRLTLQRGCVVGSVDSPTTVRGDEIRIEPGVRCHGTVWAQRRGDLLVPKRSAATGAGPDQGDAA